MHVEASRGGGGKGRGGSRSNKGKRGTGKRKESPMGSAGRSLWRGEPWANHGDLDNGKSGEVGKIPRTTRQL